MLRFASLAAVVMLGLSAGSGRAGYLVIPPTTVLGTDVFAGPSLTTSMALTAADLVTVSAAGTVDLAGGNFTANAAGVIVGPSTTNTGNSPGQTASGPGGNPYAALLIGNTGLGFFPLFVADASTGLGSPTPPTTLTETVSLGSIFGPTFTAPAGTVLEFRVNDINTGDNSGAFVLSAPDASPTPVPPTLVAAGLAALVGLPVWRRRAGR